MNMEGFPQTMESTPKFEDRLKAVFERVYGAIAIPLEEGDADANEVARSHIKAFETDLPGALSSEAKEVLAKKDEGDLFKAITALFQYFAQEGLSMEAESISKEDLEKALQESTV